VETLPELAGHGTQLRVAQLSEVVFDRVDLADDPRQLALGLPGLALGLPGLALGLPGPALGLLPGLALGLLPGLALGLLPGLALGLLYPTTALNVFPPKLISRCPRWSVDCNTGELGHMRVVL